MNASNYLEAKILNDYFTNPPAPLYLALYISDPTDNDTGTEVSGGDYERKPIIFTAPVQIGGKATVQNSTEIRFPVATSKWGTISHWGVRDAMTGGNLLSHAAFPVSKIIESGDEAKFTANSLTISAG